MVNRDPDLVWKLGADLVNCEGRKQANDGIGDTGANGGYSSMFSRFGADESVKATLDPLNCTRSDQLAQLIIANPQLIDLTRTKEDSKAGRLKPISVEFSCDRHLKLSAILC